MTVAFIRGKTVAEVALAGITINNFFGIFRKFETVANNSSFLRFATACSAVWLQTLEGHENFSSNSSTMFQMAIDEISIKIWENCRRNSPENPIKLVQCIHGDKSDFPSVTALLLLFLSSAQSFYYISLYYFIETIKRLPQQPHHRFSTSK
jgi:hypothetical protein